MIKYDELKQKLTPHEAVSVKDNFSPGWSWEEFFNTPPSEITEDLWLRANVMAGEWPTCAVGNLCSIIPRNEWEAPIDDELTDLGVRFMRLIRYRKFNGAKELFNAIEGRAAHLIEEILIERQSKKAPQ